MAQSRHPDPLNQCPLSGVKQTWASAALMSPSDPKRTSDDANFGAERFRFRLGLSLIKYARAAK
jgi:hypothetical protein